MSRDVRALLAPIRRLHERIRAEVVAACERASVEELSGVEREAESDTIYELDRFGEARLVEFFEREVATPDAPVVLVAEGLEAGRVVLPRGAREAGAAWRVIVDPIDGTRGLMYQKRSAWVLTGVAPERGPSTGLADIELAVQTEIPLVKQHLSDALWAVRGRGASAERVNRLTGERAPLRLRPSRAESIAHGFAMVARFFPGARDELAAIDEEIVRGALGPAPPGKALCFEDQYLSSGGQLYELMAGHDRFVADLRPLVRRADDERPLCCHPYDLCAELIARELGVVVTDARGGPLDAPLEVGADVAWAGYANEHLRRQIEPLLLAALERRGLL
ncbi:MAG TPA: inositol monophosphatase family protein [Pyrinomonadaceae bacterium]|nr:inositol monophosphatase family protein [Pyrinomonadaceae bacterium]